MSLTPPQTSTIPTLPSTPKLSPAPPSPPASPPLHPSPQPPPLLRLPPELRDQIYALLTPARTLSYPLGPSAITALTHAPPLSLLLTSRQLSAEALAHFYRVAHFRLMLSASAWIDAHFTRLAATPQLARVRHLDVLLDWEVPAAAVVGWEKGLAPPGAERYVEEMGRRVRRLVGVVEGGAAALQCLVVSWTDMVPGFWEMKREVLACLEGFRGRGVRVLRGEVVAEEQGKAEELFEGWEGARENFVID